MLNLQRDTNTIFKDFIDHPNFVLIEGDIEISLIAIRLLQVLIMFCIRCSVPRSIKDPITTNDVCGVGFEYVNSSSRC
jgi:hypothetical protein